MKKFYFGGDEDGDDEDEGEGMEDFGAPGAHEIIAMTHMDSPSRHLMELAVRVCEKSMLWGFASPEDKIASIKKVFYALMEMEKEYDLDADV